MRAAWSKMGSSGLSKWALPPLRLNKKNPRVLVRDAAIFHQNTFNTTNSQHSLRTGTQIAIWQTCQQSSQIKLINQAELSSSIKPSQASVGQKSY
jgi:hypothetical protein